MRDEDIVINLIMGIHGDAKELEKWAEKRPDDINAELEYIKSSISILNKIVCNAGRSV